MRLFRNKAARGAFALALLIVGAAAALSFWSVSRLIDTAQWVSHTEEVLDRVDDLQLAVTRAESAGRGFELSGGQFRQPFEEAVQDVERIVAEMQALTADNPRQERRMSVLKDRIAEKIEFHRRKMDVHQRSGPEAARDLFFGGRGQQLMAEIHRLAEDMKADEGALLRRRMEAEQRSAQLSVIALLVGSLLSFAILVAVYLYLEREIARRRRSEFKLAHLNRLYAVLSEINQAIVRVHDRETLFQEACRIAVEHGQLRMAWVGAADADSGLVEPLAHWGVEDGYLKNLRISVADKPEGKGPTGTALREGRHFVCADIGNDPRMLPWRDEALRRGYRSAAAVPIAIDGKLVGAFTVYASDPDFFDEKTVALLDEVATDLSFAVKAIEQEAQRKVAEEQVRKLNEELEARIEERTAQLAELNRQQAVTNEELARASRMKSEFLARMSHELRTPLNAIVGFSDLLGEESDGPLGDTQRDYVRHVQDGAQHLLQLVNDVLDLSKIEAGRIELRYEDFAAADAVGEVLSVIAPLAEIKGIRLESGVSSGLRIYADRTRFKQILYNLLSNAVKFTPEDGRVGVEVSEEYGEACFMVVDTGVGIPEEEHEAIFREFHQLGPAASGVKEGTGLGLAITKRLVELHGGRIWVRGEPGGGSRFFFTFRSASAAGCRSQTAGS